MLNPLSRAQLETITLWYLVQHSLSSFYKISQHYAELAHAIQPDQVLVWQALGIHANHVQRLKEFDLTEAQHKFLCVLLVFLGYSCSFLLHSDPYYLHMFPRSSIKSPFIFDQGCSDILFQAQIEIAGSRMPSPHGRQVGYDFSF